MRNEGGQLSSVPIPLFTIPSSDHAFRDYVERIRRGTATRDSAELETRLRALFPRVLVSERNLSGEPPSWYVYRDGGWVPSLNTSWWETTGLPRVTTSLDGWIEEANRSARALLGIEMADARARHFTDFVAPGTLEDSRALFAIVEHGRDLTGTVLLRPTSGDVVAVDLRAVREGARIVAVFRLADGVEIASQHERVARPKLICRPEEDAAFRGYAEMALSGMPEPAPDLLAIRLRRLYPHARVEVDASGWVASRDPAGVQVPAHGWWRDAELPRVRYDQQALILEANSAAEALLGTPVVGHFWQEFVTPGSTEQVSAMLAILSTTGAAVSRFRMPTADGSLVEFDSYTAIEDDVFVTVMRPNATDAGSDQASEGSRRASPPGAAP